MALVLPLSVFCPVCSKRLEGYSCRPLSVVPEPPTMICEPLTLYPCHHKVRDFILDEGGLIRWVYLSPERIYNPVTIKDHGWNAFLDGVQSCENPYPGWWRREKYNEWEEGWKQARHRATEQT